jgi:hypothetical protein
LESYPDFTILDRTPAAIGSQILRAYEQRNAFVPDALRALVVNRHDLESYTERIYGILSELARA